MLYLGGANGAPSLGTHASLLKLATLSHALVSALHGSDSTARYFPLRLDPDAYLVSRRLPQPMFAPPLVRTCSEKADRFDEPRTGGDSEPREFGRKLKRTFLSATNLLGEAWATCGVGRTSDSIILRNPEIFAMSGMNHILRGPRRLASAMDRCVLLSHAGGTDVRPHPRPQTQRSRP